MSDRGTDAYNWITRHASDIHTLIASSSRSATLVVAANDASAKSKDMADYVCDGTADDVDINAAITALPSGGGRVILTEGAYNITSTVAVDGKTDVILEGQGWSSNIVAPSSGGLAKMVNLGKSGSVSTRCWVKNLKLTGNTGLTGTGDGLMFGAGANNTAVNCGAENIYIAGAKDSGIAIYGDNTRIVGCYSIGNGVNLYTSDVASDVEILGGVYKDTITSSSGEVFYLAGPRPRLIGIYAERSTTGQSNPELIDLKSTGIDALIMSNTFVVSHTTQSNGCLLGATGGRFIGNHIVSSSTTTTAGAGIRITAPNWIVNGTTFKWGTNMQAISLESDATRIRISDCICTSGAWFVRLYDIAGDVDIINCHANSSSVTDAIRIDTVTKAFNGLRIIGGSYTGLAGYALRYVEGGGNNIDYIYASYSNFSGNTGGTHVGAVTGVNVAYTKVKGEDI